MASKDKRANDGKTTLEYDRGGSFDASLDNLYAEIQEARGRSKEIFSQYDEQRRRFVGPFYEGRHSRDAGGSPENPDYEWFALMRAQIVAGKPGWLVEQRRADIGRMEAIAVQHGLMRWTIETKLKTSLRQFFSDWAFRRCVGYVTRVPQAGADLGVEDGPAMRPQLLRISPRRLMYDPMATEWNETRWRGHESIVSIPFLYQQAKNALASDPESGWDLKAISELQPGGDLNSLRPGRMANRTMSRQEVPTYTVWVPEDYSLEETGNDGEEGYNGAIYTLAATTTKDQRTGKHKAGLVEIREPQRYFGPQMGPYLMSGQEYVPDEVEPLSVFVATEAQVRSFMRRARVVSDAIDAYKLIALVNSKDSTLASRIHSGKHRGVINLPGVTKDSVVPLELGGMTAQLTAQYQWDSEKIDRLRGISDAMRGVVTGVGTATENAMAASGSQARTHALRDVWYEFVGDIGRHVGWYMVEDDQSVVHMPPAVAERAGGPSKWRGGTDGGVRFDDLEIDVEPLSMEYKSTQQIRQEAQMKLEAAMALGPSIIQNPHINWDHIVTQFGQAFGDVKFREIVNYVMAGQIAGVMLGGQIMGAAQSGAPPAQEPRLGGDVPGARQAVGGARKSPGSSMGGNGASNGAPKRQELPGAKTGRAAASKAKNSAGAA